MTLFYVPGCCYGFPDSLENSKRLFFFSPHNRHFVWWCPFFFFFLCGSVQVSLGKVRFWQGEKYGALRLTEVPPWSDASSGHSGKMFGGWRTQFAPLRPVAEPLNRHSASLTHLALWITALALGFVAGSEPGTVESLHHIHLAHGNKRHHIVPIAIHRSPASLRAGHSKYLLASMHSQTSRAVCFRLNQCC